MYRKIKLWPALRLRTQRSATPPLSYRLVATAAVLAAMIAAAGCGAISALRGTSSAAKTKAAGAVQAIPAGHTATLELASGNDVEGQTTLPPGFTPDTGVAPMWLENGAMVAVAGHVGGRTELIGFSRADLRKARLIVADSPPPQLSRIVALAASPNGTMLAVARLFPAEHRIELLFHTLISSGSVYRAAAFDGDFDMVSLAWVGPNTVAFALRPAASEAGEGTSAGNVPLPREGGQATADNDAIHFVNLAANALPRKLSLNCRLSALSWSPDARFAVSQGDNKAPPSLIDSNTGSCHRLEVKGPIRVLGWFENRFLYSALSPVPRVPAVFYYDAATGHGGLVAVSSTAAAWSSAGTAVALGSQQVTWQSAVRAPNTPIPADVATLSFAPYYVNVKSLGIRTAPLLLAQSTMDYTAATDTAAIDLYVPGPVAPRRWMYFYSVPAGMAVPLGSGRVEGRIATSWSPDGRALAVVDGYRNLWTLTIVREPPFGAIPSSAAATVLRVQRRAAS